MAHPALDSRIDVFTRRELRGAARVTRRRLDGVWRRLQYSPAPAPTADVWTLTGALTAVNTPDADA